MGWILTDKDLDLILAGKIETDKVVLEQVATTDTYETLEDYFAGVGNAGHISGGAITDNLDGTISVAAGTGMIKTTDSDTGAMQFFDWDLTEDIALTEDAVNYVYVDYNSGSPQVSVTTDLTTVTRTTQFAIGAVWAHADYVHKFEGGQELSGFMHKLYFHLVEDDGIHRASGLVTSHSGTRNVAITAGIAYWGLKRINISAFDSSGADTFDYMYQDGGGGWTEVEDQSQIDNTYYDDGDGGLAELTPNRYGVHWVYCLVDGEIYVVYGQGDYTLAQAEAATVPSTMPEECTGFGFLVSKIIIQKGASSFTEIVIPWDATVGVSIPTDHGGLSGLSDDDHTQYIRHNLSTAANDFLVGSGSNTFIKKTLAEVGAILEADIDHGNIQGLGDDDHTQYSLVTGARAFTGTVTIEKATSAELLIDVSSGANQAAGVTLKNDAQEIELVLSTNDSLYLKDITLNGNILEYTPGTPYWYFSCPTSDGSDTGEISIRPGGGVASADRGAYVKVCGNEHASQAGDIVLVPGSTGDILVTGKIGINGDAEAVQEIKITGGAAHYSGICVVNTGNYLTYEEFDSNRSAINNVLHRTSYFWNGNEIARIDAMAGQDATDKDEGQIRFATGPAGGAGPTTRLTLREDGEVYIGTNAITAAKLADMTIGLVIDQYGNNDEAFALRDSYGEIAHGGVGSIGTDTYLAVKKSWANSGGVNFRAAADTGATSRIITLNAHTMDNVDDTKSTAGRGMIELYGSKISGGSETALNANANLVSIRCYNGSYETKWLIDEDGDTWQDGNAIIEGNVRIGSADAPSYELHVVEADSPRVMIQATGANSTARYMVQNDARVWSLGITGSDTFNIYNDTGAAEVINISTGGDVGIGEASSGQTLHVYHPTDNAICRLKSGDAACTLKWEDSGQATGVEAGCVSDDFTVYLDGSRKLTLKSQGLCIGTTSFNDVDEVARFYVAGNEADLMIENDAARRSAVLLKNSLSEYQVFNSSSGAFSIVANSGADTTNAFWYYTPGTGSIFRNATADGADDEIMQLGGGGGTSNSRGAVINLYGNEHANTGDVAIHAGDVTGGDIILYTDNTKRMTIDDGGEIIIGNTDSTTGVTLQLYAAANHLAFKESDGTQEYRMAVNGDVWFIEDENTGYFPVKLYEGAYTNALVVGSVSGAARSVMVGDTANAQNTYGLTVNQGGEDTECISLKSSDVAHGYTGNTETDTYGYLEKSSAAGGGLALYGLMDSGGGDAKGIYLNAHIENNADTGKTGSDEGIIALFAAQISGGAQANVVANGNIFSIRCYDAAPVYKTKWLLDEDGDWFYDGADGGAFDDYEDAQLVRAFSLATSKEVIKSKWDEYVSYNEDTLVEAGILGARVEDGGLVCGSQLLRLHNGAIWQLYQELQEAKEQISMLERKLLEG